MRLGICHDASNLIQKLAHMFYRVKGFRNVAAVHSMIEHFIPSRVGVQVIAEPPQAAFYRVPKEEAWCQLAVRLVDLADGAIRVMREQCVDPEVHQLVIRDFHAAPSPNVCAVRHPWWFCRS